MWGLVRTVVAWVIGDDLFKYLVYLVVGLFALAFTEASGATVALMAQPFGQWWLAGVSGGAQSSQTVATAPEQQAQAQPITVPTLVPQPTARPIELEQLVGSRAVLVIAAAMQYLGTPYLWGGCSRRGIDCSCFVQNALAAVGIRSPRVTTEQIRWTTPVSAAAARAGDLVFFDNTCVDCGANPTHVGLYLGDGRMADCGDPCRVEPVYGGHNARYGRVPGL